MLSKFSLTMAFSLIAAVAMPVSALAAEEDVASGWPTGIYRLTAINHFTLDAGGLIRRLEIHSRPNLMK